MKGLETFFFFLEGCGGVLGWHVEAFSVEFNAVREFCKVQRKQC